MSVDAFSQEVYNRLCQLPNDKAAQNPLEVLHIIVADVAVDFWHDDPEALHEFIRAAARRNKQESQE